MIISYSDLTGILGLPIDNAAMQVKIDSLIEDCQENLLLDLLGQNEYTLYNETESNYTELINGKADLFEYAGINYKWDGLSKCLKNLVYYRHLEENKANNTENGMVKMKMQGENVDIIRKNISIYNKYIDEFNLALIFIAYLIEQGSLLYTQTDLTPRSKMNFWGI